MTTMMELPLDAFHTVLYRLPLKYLIRLRCVSQFFLALTNNQNFIFDYRNPPPDPDLLNDDFNFMDTTTTTTSSSSLVLASSSSSTSSNQWQLPWRFHIMFKGSNFIYLQKRHELIPFHCPKTQNHKRLIGSINGLVCFFGGPACSLEIYNILAGTNFNLIYPDTTDLIPEIFDPPPKFAFGYDPISNDYNTLCLDYLAPQLYSFRNNSWKQLNLKSCSYYYAGSIIIRGGGRSVCINGIIYWPPGNHHWDYYNKDNNYNKKMIVLFDLHKEKFSEIHLPELEEEKDLLLPILNIQLLSFRGCLAFAFINKRKGGGKVAFINKRKGGGGRGRKGGGRGGGGGGEIWVELFKLKSSSNAEEENNYSWIRKSFVVPIPSTRQKEAEIVSCCDEIFLGWFESKKQLRLYNLHTKEFFNLPLSPLSHYYPKKVSLGKKINDTTYIDNLRFDFSLI